MTRRWQCEQDGKACALCKSLDGLPDGRGWSSLNGRETDLWELDASGEYTRRTPARPTLYGTPPLHPKCRCKIVVDDDGNDEVA